MFDNDISFTAIDLQIAHNMVIPVLNSKSFTVLKQMYKDHGAYDIALNSFGISQTFWGKLPEELVYNSRKKYRIAVDTYTKPSHKTRDIEATRQYPTGFSKGSTETTRQYPTGFSKGHTGGSKFTNDHNEFDEVCIRPMPNIDISTWDYLRYDITKSDMPQCVYALITKIKSNIFINSDRLADIAKKYTGDKLDNIKLFLGRNPVINTHTGSPVPSVEIEICMNVLSKYISDQLIPSLIYKHADSILNFMYYNANTMLKITQTNMMINHLKSVDKIINGSGNLDKDKFVIFESASYMDIPKIPDVSSLLFMIFFGFFFTNEQVQRYSEMDLSLKEERKRFPVHHFMMGKGKSSVITPLIAINSRLMNKETFVVVPTHLLKQTEDTFGVIRDVFDLNKLHILKDYDAKLRLLTTGFNNDIVLILDEIDMMLNPLQSTFQIIVPPKETLSKDVISSGIEILNNLRDNVDLDKGFLSNNIQNIYNMRHIKKIDFGMSQHDYKEGKFIRRTVIPYARKDSPIEKSEFSSPIVTLVLTYKYFMEDLILEKQDMINFFKSRDTQLLSALDSKLATYTKLHIFIEYATEIFASLSPEKKQSVIEYYLQFYIFPTIEITLHKKNCSMVDIMGMDKIMWGIGYSGTVNVDFPELCDECKGFNSNVITDYDEKISMDMIFNRTYENTQNNSFELITKEIDLWDRLGDYKYSALVDLAGLLKDYDNFAVVRKVSTLSNYSNTSTSYIYLDDKDTKKIFDDHGDRRYNGQEFSSGNDVFYFYSQKNTVGTDFKQPANMKCMVVINKDNTLTEVAQAIWRARKMIRGHTVNIVMVDPYGTQGSIDGPSILEMLTLNSEKYLESQKGLLTYQNIKWLTRQSIDDSDHTKYLETGYLTDYMSIPPTKQFILDHAVDIITTNHTELKNYVRDHKLFAELSKNDGISGIVLGINATEFVGEMEEDVDVEQDLTIIRKSINYMKRDKTIKEWYFIPNELLKKQVEYLTVPIITYQHKSDSMYIVYSTELFLNWYRQPYDSRLPSISLVKLLPNTYILTQNMMTQFYYNKFPIYDVFGDLINKYQFGKDNNTHIKFPTSVQIFGGFIPYNGDELRKTILATDKHLADIIHLLIYYETIDNSVLKLFDTHQSDLRKYNIKNIPKLLDLVTRTNKKVDEEIDTLNNAVIDYNKNYTGINKTAGESIEDIIALHQPPSMMQGGGINKELYNKYTRYKYKYIQLRAKII